MKVSPFKQAVGWMLLISLSLVLACSTGPPPPSRSTALTPAHQEEQDPEFWKNWQNERGLGE